MNNITLNGLREALAKEELVFSEEDEAKLLRAWRQLENPNGCRFCGQHVLVGVPKKRRGKDVLVAACCGVVLA